MNDQKSKIVQAVFDYMQRPKRKPKKQQRRVADAKNSKLLF